MRQSPRSWSVFPYISVISSDIKIYKCFSNKQYLPKAYTGSKFQGDYCGK
jgi:hypothetical protein